MLQSSTKMLRKTDIKIKLLKALTTTNTPPSPPPKKMDVKITLLKALAATKLYSPLPPPPPKKNNVEVQVDHLWPWLNNFDQGGVRERAIAVPNPGNRHSVGKTVKNSEHFLSKMVATACPNSKLYNWLSLHPDWCQLLSIIFKRSTDTTEYRGHC